MTDQGRHLSRKADKAEASALENLLRRDRWIMITLLAALAGLAWVYLLNGAGTGMSTIAMSTWRFPPPRPAMAMPGAWDQTYWLVMFVMWLVMMIAMMIPSAAPMILLYARVERRGCEAAAARAQRTRSVALAPAASFTIGYLAAWAFFSALATALQWALERAGVVDGMMMWSTEKSLTAGLLVVAGVYQLTPWKDACLVQCRAPTSALSASWQPGSWGAFSMGLKHGSFCLGCCWALMLLLFAGGIMNAVWISGLAIIVLVEKIFTRGRWFSLMSGIALIAAGLAIMVT